MGNDDLKYLDWKYQEEDRDENIIIIAKPKTMKVAFRECMSFKPRGSRFDYDAMYAGSQDLGIPAIPSDINSKIREKTIPIHNKYIYIFRTAGKNEKPGDGISVLLFAEVKGTCSSVKSKIGSKEATDFVYTTLKKFISADIKQREKIFKEKHSKYVKDHNSRRQYLRKKCMPELAKKNGKFGICSKRIRDMEPAVLYEKDFVELEMMDGVKYFACIVNHYLPMARITKIRRELDESIKAGYIYSLNQVYTPINHTTLLKDPDAKSQDIKTVILIDHLSEIEFLYSHFKICRDVITQYILEMKHNDETEVLKQVVFNTIVKAHDADDYSGDYNLKEYLKCITDGDALYSKMSNDAVWITRVREASILFGTYLTIWLKNIAGKERILDYKHDVDAKYYKCLNYLDELASIPEGFQFLSQEYRDYASNDQKNYLKFTVDFAGKFNEYAKEKKIILKWAPAIVAVEGKNADKAFKKLLTMYYQNKILFDEINIKLGLNTKIPAILDEKTLEYFSQSGKYTPSIDDVTDRLKKGQYGVASVLSGINLYMQVYEMCNAKNITYENVLDTGSGAFGFMISLLELNGITSIGKLSTNALGPFAGGIDGLISAIKSGTAAAKGDTVKSLIEGAKTIGSAMIVIGSTIKKGTSWSPKGWIILLFVTAVEFIIEEDDDMPVWLRHCQLGICTSCTGEEGKKYCSMYRILKNQGRENECRPDASDFKKWTLKVNMWKYEWPYAVEDQLDSYLTIIGK